MSEFTLRTLGPLTLAGPDGDLLVNRRKDLALLAYLARHAPTPVPRAELAALLWGDRDDARARSSLRQSLLKIKQAIGPALHPDGVWVDGSAIDLDVNSFDADIAAGRLAEAVRRWRGEFMEGLDDIGDDPFRSWVMRERRVLRQKLDRAFDLLIDGAHDRNELDAAIEWAAHRAGLWKLAESPQLALINLLRERGRSAEAVSHADEFEARLHAELELAPGAEFLATAARIRGSMTATGQAVRATDAVRLVPGLVGRDRSMRQLMDAWDRVRAGRAETVIIEGVEGLGKTRLCDEFVARIENSGRACTVMRTAALSETGSYATAESALRGLRSAPGLAGASNEDLAEVARIVPSLHARFALPSPNGTDDALRASLARVLADVAAEQPVLLLVDNLPHADKPSRALFQALQHRAPNGVLILLTARPEDIAILDEGARITDTAQRVRLKPLTSSESAQLLQSMITVDPEQQSMVAGWMHAQSGGNPLYLVEIILALIEDGHITADAAGLWHASNAVQEGVVPIPRSVLAALHRRLTHVTASAASVLDAASVFEGPFKVAVVARILGTSPDAISESIGELVERRFIRQAPDDAGCYVFVQSALRRMVYDALDPVARKTLHGAAASTLVDTPGTPPALIAYHRTRGGTTARSRRPWLVAAIVLIAAIATSVTLAATRDTNRVPIIAVGTIRDLAAAPDVAVALSELMTTELARSDGARVISSPRLYEVAAQIDTARMRSNMERAARAAGAQQYIDGALFREGTQLRLDLRRIDLQSARVLAVFTVRANDAYALAEEASARVLNDLHIQVPTGRLADVTTRSIVALRFYQEGLQAIAQNDPGAGRRFFEAAIQEDTSFAMATFELAKLDRTPEMNDRALRLSMKSSDHERLLVRAYLTDSGDDPQRLAIADTLAIRYPGDPAALRMLGRAQNAAALFLPAAESYQRAIDLDVAIAGRAPDNCRACGIYSDYVTALVYADSMQRAERIAREFTKRYPRSVDSWGSLYWVMHHSERFEEAMEADRRARIALGSKLGVSTGTIDLWVKQGRFDEAERALKKLMSASTGDDYGNALWGYIIMLRNAGRFTEALPLAEHFRVGDPMQPGQRYWNSGMRALLLFDLKRYREAAALRDSSVMLPFGITASRRARSVTGELTHMVTSYAAMGDTTRVRILVDSIYTVSRFSGYERDRRLPFYARGLYYEMLGRNEDAVRELRQSIYSPLGGYGRANLELGRALLATGRAKEALYIVDAGMRGPLGASGLYATQPELRLLRAQAREATGDRRGALSDYLRVIQDWSRADAVVEPEKQRAIQRATALRAAGVRL